MKELFAIGLDPEEYDDKRKRFKELYDTLNKKTKDKKVEIMFPEGKIPANFDVKYDVDEELQKHSLSEFINKLPKDLPECPLRGGVMAGSACWWQGMLSEVIDKLLFPHKGGRKTKRKTKRKRKRKRKTN